MTLSEIYKNTTTELQKAGADSPAFDAVWLINSVLDVSRQQIVTDGDRPVSEEDAHTIIERTQRRISGEPLQYIIGYWEFFGRKFYVGEGVLIPRDDTEVVIRSTFEHLDNIYRHRPVKILDLCSGSGIIAITLKLRYPKAQVTAVEISPDALMYLRKNADSNNAEIHIIHDDIFHYADSIPEQEYDLIISNPPYIPSDEMLTLQDEVRREPALALDGGEDGCDFYRRIIPVFTPKLKSKGMLALEYDSTQSRTISQLMAQYGYKNICVYKDIGDVDRAINGTVD
ncbi:MAG: peptide chain release factor N(5)-glutamine methyltransferase [Ruminococcus sp.]|nr:peptide chain release factor N(5)-glutamine methyltransferase [Ruminococcus sp.]